MTDITAVVREFFACLGRGDLEGVVSLVADHVDWQSPVTRSYSAEIPWSQTRYTREEVAAFFLELGQTVKPEGFELLEICAQDDRVMVEGRNKGTVRSSGATYEHEWVMIFTVRGDKITRFRHYYDTADLLGVLSSTAHREVI